MCCGTPSPSFSQEAWKAARLRDKSANPASSWGTHHFEGGGLGQHAALVVAVQRAGNLLLQHWAWGACGNVVMYSCGNVVTYHIERGNVRAWSHDERTQRARGSSSSHAQVCMQARGVRTGRGTHTP